MRVIDYVNQGGLIMYILLAFNVIGITLMLIKFFLIAIEGKKSDVTATTLSNKIKNDFQTKDHGILLELIKQEISAYVKKLEVGINTIKIIASISPLLGLLGTVIGVLMAFRVMSETGLTNPELFAEGISVALLTTVGGLIVAIPHYIGHSYLLGLIDNFESALEKQLLAKLL
ncbi:MAG: MotA/TolQ/ExbB proton channel family protein [Bacteriovoracaceae bacterium]|nr:MotA/TolQ/ExbB proton channel family protein [Bacteriovoracaceae bacterium]